MLPLSYVVVMDADGQNGRDFQRISISYACTGREGGFAYKRTQAYSEGGRVEKFDFFAYVIKVWPLTVLVNLHFGILR